AWDIAAGTLAAAGLLAADRHRTRTGEGQFVRLALSDVALAMAGNLGRIAQAQLVADEQPQDGNFLYGAFGASFPTSDGRHVMVVALTRRQWQALQEATGTTDGWAEIEQATGQDLSTEGGRFLARDAIKERLRPWFAARDLATIRAAFTEAGVSWGPFQTFHQLVDEDPRCSTDNPLFAELEQPGIGRYLVPRSPLEFSAVETLPARRAPILGEHTEEVLADVLGLDGTEIARLHDDGVVAGPRLSRT
ncbi:MAG: CoA transferase, partial [Actinomycetota bacterium]|nr:CoA transferase [Actinomycetota bacterium]